MHGYIKRSPHDITDAVGELIAFNKRKKLMNNQVNSTDVTLFSLSLGALGGVVPALLAHDYIVSGGLFVFGLVLAYCYHKFGSSTSTPVV